MQNTGNLNLADLNKYIMIMYGSPQKNKIRLTLENLKIYVNLQYITGEKLYDHCNIQKNIKEKLNTFQDNRTNKYSKKGKDGRINTLINGG